jgi:alkylation response protein AidB-like acyl-CoA dehydrogenase
MFEYTMTDDELEAVLDKARSVSQFFREIGPQYDEENTFAFPSIRVFRDSGLGALQVPKEFGGLGGDLLTTSKVVSELSRGDSAITLAYNMHYIMVGIAGSLMSEDQNKYWLGRVADGDLMFGPFSEQRAGFSGLADMKAIPQPGGGWKLHGKKVWGTLSEAADIITTNATITDADGNLPEDFQDRVNAESLFIGEFDVDENGQGDGIRIEKTWDALGMHATGTQTIVFDGYFVPEDGFICEWRSGAFGVLEWASLLFASIYYGMQQRILEEATAVLSKKTLGATFGAIVATETKVAGVGHIIDGVGDFASRVELSRRVLYQTLHRRHDRLRRQLADRVALPLHRAGQDLHRRQRPVHEPTRDEPGRRILVQEGRHLRTALPRLGGGDVPAAQRRPDPDLHR